MSKTREEILAAPVSSIRDGWVLKNGELYLFVQIENTTYTITVPRSH